MVSLLRPFACQNVTALSTLPLYPSVSQSSPYFSTGCELMLNFACWIAPSGPDISYPSFFHFSHFSHCFHCSQQSNQSSSPTPLSLIATPSPKNIFSVVEASWTSSDQLISRIVLSPSLTVLAQSHNGEASPAKVELVSFSCTCLLKHHKVDVGSHHASGSEEDGEDMDPGNSTKSSAVRGEERSEANQMLQEKSAPPRLIPHNALCPHLLSMLSVISKSPETVVRHQATLEAFESISAEEIQTIMRSLLASPQHLSLSSIASKLEEASAQKQSLAAPSKELNHQAPQYSQQEIEQEAIDAATTGGLLSYGLLPSILPDPKSAGFCSSISTQLKQLIQFRRLQKDSAAIISNAKSKINGAVAALKNRNAMRHDGYYFRYGSSFDDDDFGNDGSNPDTMIGAATNSLDVIMLKRDEDDRTRLESVRDSLVALIVTNTRFIKQLFRYDCPKELVSGRFSGQGWIYLLKMATVVLNNAEGIRQAEHWFEPLLSQLDSAFASAATNTRSYSLLGTTTADLLTSRVLPTLVEICKPFKGNSSYFVLPYELISSRSLNADITSIISGKEIAGGSAVTQKMLNSESYGTTQHRLKSLLEQKDYFGASRLAFAYDSMDILAALALQSSDEVFDDLFATMVEVIYTSAETNVLRRVDPISKKTTTFVSPLDPSTPLPFYLTCCASPRPHESLLKSASYFTALLRAENFHSPVNNMKIWVTLFALMDYGAMYLSPAIRSGNLLSIITNASNISNLVQILLKVSAKSPSSAQRTSEAPSLLSIATATAVYTSASTFVSPSSSPISTPLLLSQLQMLDWDSAICAHFRNICIIFMTLGLIVREVSSADPSKASMDHAISFFSSFIPSICNVPELVEYDIIWQALNSLLAVVASRPASDINKYMLSLCGAFCCTPKRFMSTIASAILVASRAAKDPSRTIAPIAFHVLEKVKPKNIALYNELMADASLIDYFFSSSLQAITPTPASEIGHVKQALESVLKKFHHTKSEADAEEMYQSLKTVLLRTHQATPISKSVLTLILDHVMSLKGTNLLLESCRQWIAFLLSSGGFLPSHCQAVVVAKDPTLMPKTIQDIISCFRTLNTGQEASSAPPEFEIATIRSFVSFNIQHSTFLPILSKFYGKDLLYKMIEPSVAPKLSLSEQVSCFVDFFGKRNDVLKFMDYRGSLDSDSSHDVIAKITEFVDFLRDYTSSRTSASWKAISSCIAVNQDAQFAATFEKKMTRIAQSFPLHQVLSVLCANNVDAHGSRLEDYIGPHLLYIYRFWRLHSFISTCSEDDSDDSDDIDYIKRELQSLVFDFGESIKFLVPPNADELAALDQGLNQVICDFEFTGISTVISDVCRQIQSRPAQNAEGFRVFLGPISLPTKLHPADRSDPSKRSKHE